MQEEFQKLIDTALEKKDGVKLKRRDVLKKYDNFKRRSSSVVWRINEELGRHGLKFKPSLQSGEMDDEISVIQTKKARISDDQVSNFGNEEFDPITRLSELKASKTEPVSVNPDNLPETDLSGTLYGGNLSILYSMLGSEDLPDFEHGILFIEDIDEYLYHIERMMLSLKRAEKMQHLSALVVGGMTDMNDHGVPFGKSAKEIILDVTGEYNYPVIFNFPAGHQKDHSIAFCFN